MCWDGWPKPPREAVLPRCALLLDARPRVLDRPLPLLEGGCVLPRPLPRKLPPLTDDMVVTVEVVEYWRHVLRSRQRRDEAKKLMIVRLDGYKECSPRETWHAGAL